MSDKFNATCQPGSVIMMTHAMFGSMATGKCLEIAYHCQEVRKVI